VRHHARNRARGIGAVVRACGLPVACASLVFAWPSPGRPPAPGTPIEPTEPIEAPESDPESGELFPHVAIDRAEGFVDVAGYVPIVTAAFEDERPPDVLLELVVAGFAGGRDHETLVTTKARASHVHAALLVLGLEPGGPGTWEETYDEANERWVVRGTPPEGPAIDIQFRWTDPQTGEARTADPREWVRHIETNETLPDEPWRFAGSIFVRRQGRERYDADFTGTIVGLCQFGSEVLGFAEPYHHDQALQRPIWFARNEAVPPFGTEVTVRLRPVQEACGDEQRPAEQPSEREPGQSGPASPADSADPAEPTIGDADG
jgi:hypothetical protein